jgi:hypothetical protein
MSWEAISLVLAVFRGWISKSATAMSLSRVYMPLAALDRVYACCVDELS